eukprot:4643826-Prorocentrum_lima.AAC.1
MAMAWSWRRLSMSWSWVLMSAVEVEAAVEVHGVEEGGGGGDGGGNMGELSSQRASHCCHI